jgi:putative membrane protein
MNFIFIFLKGMAMGTADLVPGVSGGTIAFISGIYERFINSLKSINLSLLKTLKQEGIKRVWEKVDGKFLLFLFAGIATAVVTFSKGIKYLLHEHPIELWSFFFGLVVASCLLVSKDVNWKKISSYILLILGIGFGIWVSTAAAIGGNDAFWYIFISGFIAISAMVLPGISGSFILLLMGSYEIVLNAISRVSEFNTSDLLLLTCFVFGMIAGLLSIVRVISWGFKKAKNEIVSALLGIMTGCLFKIWPWKTNLETIVIHDKEKVISTSNYLPELNVDFFIASAIAVSGFLLIVGLEYLGKKMRENVE